MLFLRARYPPAERPEEAVSISGDRSTTARRDIGREGADPARVRRQRVLHRESVRGGLGTLPVHPGRVEDDRRTERRPADRPHRRDTRRQLLRRRLMVLMVMMMMVTVLVVVPVIGQSPAAYSVYPVFCVTLHYSFRVDEVEKLQGPLSVYQRRAFWDSCCEVFTDQMLFLSPNQNCQALHWTNIYHEGISTTGRISTMYTKRILKNRQTEHNDNMTNTHFAVLWHSPVRDKVQKAVCLS